ncbi:MAG: carboxypeptidase-like regulatory domain-containing protein, partial [Mycobacteriales bacterium]
MGERHRRGAHRGAAAPLRLFSRALPGLALGLAVGVVGAMVVVVSAATAATAGTPVSGLVTGANGVGVGNVTVELIPVYSTGCPVSLFATTGPTGTYSISSVPAGYYNEELFPPLATPGTFPQYVNQEYWAGTSSTSTTDTDQQSGATVIYVASSPVVVNDSLLAGGEIDGSVSGGSGPVPGVFVSVYDSSLGIGSSTTVGSSGSYAVTNLAPATSYTVYFYPPASYEDQAYNGQTDPSMANPVTVTAGMQTTGIDASLVVGGQITGTVTDSSSGLGISGASVSAYPATGGGFGQSTATVSGGSYDLTSLATGTYDVYFNAPGYQSSSLPGVSVTAPYTTSGQNIALTPQPSSSPSPSPTGSPTAPSSGSPSSTSTCPSPSPTPTPTPPP